VTVTAANGDVAEYMVTLVVALGNNVELAVFQVNGADVADGDTVELEAFTSEVDVVVETTDPAATYEISGDTDLQAGENDLTVTVTAVDGVTTAVYNVILKVALSNNVELAVFTVNGSDVQDGDVVELDPYTTMVEVEVVTADADATFELSGGTELEAGENSLVVTVTAANGETTAVYNVTLNVLLSGDTSLETFTVNGNNVQDGDVLTVPAYTAEVSVEAVPGDKNSTFEITGADALEAGDNTISVVVTAPNGDTKTYSIFVKVLLSDEAGISQVMVGGQKVLNGEVILSEDLEVTEVDVEVTTVDENATFEVTGNTELVRGDNKIRILVTAPNRVNTSEFLVTYRLFGLPGNVKLESLSVAGQKIDLAGYDLAGFKPEIELPAGSKSTPVIAIAQDLSANVKVVGNQSLAVGKNLITIRVTGTDAVTFREYEVTVNVAALSSNTGLSDVKINGYAVSIEGNGSIMELPAGTRSINLVATPSDAKAHVSYKGITNLVAGNNTAIVRVTAQDGTFKDYSFLVNAPGLSNDAGLSSFTIQGFNVLSVQGTNAVAKSKISVLPGTTKLNVSAVASGIGASVTITGRDIRAGVNDVVVTVTAADGTSKTYTVKVKA
jgi:hypothetical protein